MARLSLLVKSVLISPIVPSMIEQVDCGYWCNWHECDVCECECIWADAAHNLFVEDHKLTERTIVWRCGCKDVVVKNNRWVREADVSNHDCVDCQYQEHLQDRFMYI